MFAILFALSLFMAPRALAAAPSFHTYELGGYPKESSDCPEVGKQLASRFERFTGIAPSGIKAESDSMSSCRVKLSYASEAELTLTTTSPSSPLAGKGAYASRAQCESLLPGEVSRFEKLTGLPAFVSYCELAGEKTNRPFAVRIEAFGKANTAISFYDYVIDFGRALPNAAQIEARLSANFARFGLEAVNVALRGSPAGGWFNYVSFSYYGPYRRSFDLVQPFVYSSVRGCEESAAAIASFFEKARAPLFGGFCTTQAGRTQLNLLLERPLSFSITGPPEQEAYSSLSECESDRFRVESSYLKLGWAVFGSSCGINKDDRAQMLVFARGPVGRVP